MTIKNITVYYDEEIPKKDGKYNAPIFIKSFRDGVKFYNISISGIKINGEEIDETNAVSEICETDNFTFIK